MGKEANCICELNGQAAEVKALIEPPELIIRGEIKRRIPLAKLSNLAADGTRLRFQFGKEDFALTLGREIAAKWVKTLQKPAPTLAAKLGITHVTRIKMIGAIDDEQLRRAIAAGQTVARGGSDVIIARVNTCGELESAFRRALKPVLDGAQLWIVYRKGKGHPISENDVRETGLAAGIVDVKVVAVSDQLTGLKFVRRKTSGNSPSVS